MKWVNKKLCIFVLIVGILLPNTRTSAEAPTIDKETVNAVIFDSKIEIIVSKLIECESGGKSVRIVDSNGYYSYGILQFQKRTWDWWSGMSGITGDPMNNDDAKTMARWAIKNGYLSHWSCARILGLL